MNKENETPSVVDPKGDVVLAIDALLNEIAIDVHGNPNATLHAKYADYMNALVKAVSATRDGEIKKLQEEIKQLKVELENWKFNYD